MTAQPLTGQQIAESGLTGWAHLVGGLQTRIRTKDFASGLALVNAIGAAAEEANHHPDVDLRYGHVDVRLTSHDAGGVTQRDVALARVVSGLAADAGGELDSATVSRIELALDSPDYEAVLPFWAAALGMRRPDEPPDELRDPNGATPLVWFQQSGSDEPRQRWHLDVWVDPDQIEPRMSAALAAGGTLVTDEAAPSFWVLADPQGNRMCLCTWQNRG